MVTNPRSPATIGDERPLPGNGVFQAIFSVGDQRRGAIDSWLIPSPRGPRQPGQSSALERPARAIANPTEINARPIPCDFMDPLYRSPLRLCWAGPLH